MNKIRITLFLIVVFLINSCASIPQSSDFLSLKSKPSYVVPIVGISKNIIIKQANAILINEKYGLFITYAHIIDEVEKLEVKIYNKWYTVETKEKWIDHYTNLAIVKIKRKIILPEAAPLADITSNDTTVYIQGYLAREDFKQILHFGYHSIECMAEDVDFDLNQLLENNRLRDLYQHYILIKVNSDEKIYHGMSGSILITNDKKVVGILYATDVETKTLGLVMPAYEIKKLLNKVIEDL